MNVMLALLGLVAVLIASPGLAYLTQPWSPWWIGQRQTGPISVPLGPGPNVPVEPPVRHAGAVSDAERFQLIQAAGAPVDVAIIMTALSIAEDGSGDPAIISKPNFNKTVDVGILQVNSAHIGQCGITDIAWLQDPMNNARAAMCILGPGRNYCAWSTYERSCGVGYTGAYAAFLPCARAIAEGAVCKR